MFDNKMACLLDDDDSQQQMEASEREEYEREYEAWLDNLEKKSKKERELQDE